MDEKLRMAILDNLDLTYVADNFAPDQFDFTAFLASWLERKMEKKEAYFVDKEFEYFICKCAKNLEANRLDKFRGITKVNYSWFAFLCGEGGKRCVSPKDVERVLWFSEEMGWLNESIEPYEAEELLSCCGSDMETKTADFFITKLSRELRLRYTSEDRGERPHTNHAFQLGIKILASTNDLVSEWLKEMEQDSFRQIRTLFHGNDSDKWCFRAELLGQVAIPHDELLRFTLHLLSVKAFVIDGLELFNNCRQKFSLDEKGRIRRAALETIARVWGDEEKIYEALKEEADFVFNNEYVEFPIRLKGETPNLLLRCRGILTTSFRVSQSRQPEGLTVYDIIEKGPSGDSLRFTYLRWLEEHIETLDKNINPFLQECAAERNDFSELCVIVHSWNGSMDMRPDFEKVVFENARVSVQMAAELVKNLPREVVEKDYNIAAIVDCASRFVENRIDTVDDLHDWASNEVRSFLLKRYKGSSDARIVELFSREDFRLAKFSCYRSDEDYQKLDMSLLLSEGVFNPAAALLLACSGPYPRAINDYIADRMDSIKADDNGLTNFYVKTFLRRVCDYFDEHREYEKAARLATLLPPAEIAELIDKHGDEKAVSDRYVKSILETKVKNDEDADRAFGIVKSSKVEPTSKEKVLLKILSISHLSRYNEAIVFLADVAIKEPNGNAAELLKSITSDLEMRWRVRKGPLNDVRQKIWGFLSNNQSYKGPLRQAYDNINVLQPMVFRE